MAPTGNAGQAAWTGAVLTNEQIDYSDPEWPETQYPHVDLCAGGLIYFRNHLKQPRVAPP
jgi:hypothetical protein